MSDRAVADTSKDWAVRLFRKSVLKQRKFSEIMRLLGPVNGHRCLDLGSDNGVISLLLRKEGGRWASADMAEDAVASIEGLVETEVYRTDGRTLPFDDGTFDRVVIVDMLEHAEDDRRFIEEIRRILSSGGELIVNVPHAKKSLLRWFRHRIGQTDERHGHLRSGYTRETLETTLRPYFKIVESRSYSKFFSEWVDTCIVLAMDIKKGFKARRGSKGLIVTGKDLADSRKLFQMYSLLYPLVWFVSQLDRALFFVSGYMLIAKARVNNV